MKIRPVIAHCEWAPERVQSLANLRDCPDMYSAVVVRSPMKVHANIWAPRLWRVVAELEDDVAVCLNDDVITHREILNKVEEFYYKGSKDDVLSLHCQFDAIVLPAENGHTLARCYWPSGPAYTLTPSMARRLLAWIDVLPPGWFGGPVNEDGVLAMWLWSQQRPAYCSIPALVRHDTTVPSTLGYDLHPGRKSPVDWDSFPIRPYGDREDAPYIATPWMNSEQFRALGDVLRGIVPLCGFCLTQPAHIANEVRKTGLCTHCAAQVTRYVSQNPYILRGPT